MADKTGISWTEATWNPLVGCSRVSEGCRNCYAERVAATRMRGNPDYDGIARVNADGEPRWTGEVRLIEKRLDQPLRWRKPRMIFVNSMSDLFHESVTFETIAAIFGVMGMASQHTFQVLTKRPERMKEFFRWAMEPAAPGIENVGPRVCGLAATKLLAAAGFERWGGPKWDAVRPLARGEVEWPLPNVWLGVSVEDQATANERIPFLLETPAAVRWISAEPLLGPVDLTRVDFGVLSDDRRGRYVMNALTGGCKSETPWHLNWVIVGGESGPGARPMHPDWARDIRDACAEADVPFYFKQWGEWGPTRLDCYGRNPDHVDTYSLGEFAESPMMRGGKSRTGRELDGVVHDAWPVVGEVGV